MTKVDLIKEILKLQTFMDKVDAVFNVKLPEVSGSYDRGYNDAIEQLKREIYGTT